MIFTTDGPSVVRAEISDATGRSRVCLWQGTDIGARRCDTVRNGSLEWPVFGPESIAWTLSLIGANESAAPTVNVTLNFHANAPTVEFQNLLYNGPSTPGYNGLTWSIDTMAQGSIGGDRDLRTDAAAELPRLDLGGRGRRSPETRLSRTSRASPSRRM